MTGILPRVGSTLLAIMFTSFVRLVHVPRIAADMNSRREWHLLSTALLLTGAAWIVAAALGRRERS